MSGTEIAILTSRNGSRNRASGVERNPLTAKRVKVEDVEIDGDTSGTVTLSAPTTVTDYTLTFPAAQGGNAEFLQNDGFGTLGWSTVAVPTAFTGAHGYLTGGGGSNPIARTLVDTNSGFVSVTADDFTVANTGVITCDHALSRQYLVLVNATPSATLSGSRTVNLTIAKNGADITGAKQTTLFGITGQRFTMSVSASTALIATDTISVYSETTGGAATMVYEEMQISIIPID